MQKATTPFEKAVAAAIDGTLQAPVIIRGAAQLDPLRFQLAMHKGLLRLAALGIKMKAYRLSDIKVYYGYKGRSAAEVLKEHLSLMEDFEEEREAYLRAVATYQEFGCASQD